MAATKPGNSLAGVAVKIPISIAQPIGAGQQECTRRPTQHHSRPAACFMPASGHSLSPQSCRDDRQLKTHSATPYSLIHRQTPGAGPRQTPQTLPSRRPASAFVLAPPIPPLLSPCCCRAPFFFKHLCSNCSPSLKPCSRPCAPHSFLYARRHSFRPSQRLPTLIVCFAELLETSQTFLACQSLKLPANSTFTAKPEHSRTLC